MVTGTPWNLSGTEELLTWLESRCWGSVPLLGASEGPRVPEALHLEHVISQVILGVASHVANGEGRWQGIVRTGPLFTGPIQLQEGWRGGGGEGGRKET